MQFREDFFGEEPETLLGLLPGHPTVHHVNHDLFHADGLLHGLDLLDDCFRGADGLGRAAGGEAGLRRAYVGGLAR